MPRARGSLTGQMPGYLTTVEDGGGGGAEDRGIVELRISYLDLRI